MAIDVPRTTLTGDASPPPDVGDDGRRPSPSPSSGRSAAGTAPASRQRRPRHRRFLASVRARATAVAVAVAGFAVGGCALGLEIIARRSATDHLDEALDTLRHATWIAAPALLLLSGGLVWVLVGRALRPVESIGSVVAQISGASLDRRVPQPPVADEVGRLAGSLNGMLDRLEGSARRQRCFISDLSHELRSPLSTSRVQLELALAHPDAVSLSAMAAGVLAENLRMERLVGDLLFLARSDEGHAATDFAAVDLDEVVLAEVRRLWERTSVRINIAGVSGKRVRGREDHLARVVSNLLENAERHARAGVSVQLRETEREVELAVADDGPGVAPQHRQHIFDRFVRLDGGGAGLGLAIVGDIVAAHGGRVWVEDTTGGGARFVVRLPPA